MPDKICYEKTYVKIATSMCSHEHASPVGHPAQAGDCTAVNLALLIEQLGALLFFLAGVDQLDLAGGEADE